MTTDYESWREYALEVMWFHLFDGDPVRMPTVARWLAFHILDTMYRVWGRGTVKTRRARVQS